MDKYMILWIIHNFSHGNYDTDELEKRLTEIER